MLPRQTNRSRTVFCLGHHLHIGLGFKQCAQTGAYDPVILSQKYPNDAE
jgi:hypothetical protein